MIELPKKENKMKNVKIRMGKNYCIVSSFTDDITELVNSIQILLDEGWSLMGGLTASNSKLFQALNK